MEFSIYRVIKRLWKQKIIYIIIAIQLAIGASILCFSFNQYFVEKTKFDALAQNLAKVSYIIDAYRLQGAPPRQEAITYKDYLALQELYKSKASLRYSLIGSANFLRIVEGKREAELQTINVVFMCREELEELLGIEMEKGSYYGGDAVNDYLSQMGTYTLQEKSGTRLKVNSYFSLTSDIVKFAQGGISIEDKVYNFKDIPKDAQEKKLYKWSVDVYNNEMGTQLKDCVFFPLEEIDIAGKVWTTGRENLTSRLSIKETDPRAQATYDIIKYLGMHHSGEYRYSMGNEYMQAKLQLDTITSEAKGYILMSGLQVLLISFCSSGIFYLIFAKRKKDIAVSIMVGSTLNRQAQELVAEIVFVILSGLGAGFIYFIIANAGEMPIQLSTIAVLLLIAAVTTAISAFLALKDIYQMSPVEVLQKN